MTAPDPFPVREVGDDSRLLAAKREVDESFAEPKSVPDFRDCGLPAKEAVKGPGSVDYGMKWMQKRTIVIDRRRTPNAHTKRNRS